jgi:hypothetical protein
MFRVEVPRPLKKPLNVLEKSIVPAAVEEFLVHRRMNGPADVICGS